MAHPLFPWRDHHFSKYVFVGVLNVAVCYAAFAVLVFFGVQYIVASLLSYVVGVANSYLWNKYYTFRRHGKSFSELVRFFGVYAGQYLIGLAGLIALVEVTRLGPMVSQTIVLVVSVIFSFFAHRHWTFRNHLAP